jgi:uncharacterized protein YsxB (DUF464 family)
VEGQEKEVIHITMGPHSLRCTGHAEFNNKVCVAVSTICGLLKLRAERGISFDVRIKKNESGNFECYYSPAFEDGLSVIANAKEGLIHLQKQYPEEIEIVYE